MKKLNKFTKEEIKKLNEIIGNSFIHPKTKKIRHHLNTIQILEYYGNVFNFDGEDYQVFLNYNFWIEDKEVFTDYENKKILLKISDNLHKLLELKF